jgi:hypothetical protein
MKILLEVSDDKHAILKRIKVKSGQSMTWTINTAIDNYLQDLNPTKGTNAKPKIIPSTSFSAEA